jgi:hypothetical protein
VVVRKLISSIHTILFMGHEGLMTPSRKRRVSRLSASNLCAESLR